jgi:hypothetical protein
MAEELAVKARNSISKYCYSECKSFCCRKGLLNLSEKEADLVIGSEIVKSMKANILTRFKDGKYLLNIGAKDMPCPSLNDFKCDIHNNMNRPKACKEFPIFLWENKKVRFSERCPAFREGLFYKYLAKFEKLGYVIQ